MLPLNAEAGISKRFPQKLLQQISLYSEGPFHLCRSYSTLPRSMKAALSNTHMNEAGHVPNTLLLAKTGAGPHTAHGLQVPSPALRPKGHAA